MAVKIKRVLVRELSRHAFTYSATWDRDGVEVTDVETTVSFPPEALWATEERRVEMMSEGARINLARWGQAQPSQSFRQSPELAAVNQWDGTVTISEP